LKLRDKEKELVVDILCKTAEYVLALTVLGAVIAQNFDPDLFFGGLIVYFSLVGAAVSISAQTGD